MKVTLRQVQESIANIANRNHYTEDILYELLAAYGRSPNAITQLRAGQTNRATEKGEVLQKDVVYFKVVPDGTQLEHSVEELYEDPLTKRYKPRFLIVTDLKNLAARDTINTANTAISIKLSDIDRHLEFFYGWTGDEVVDPKTEAVADRRAADKMNQLYIAIEKLNREKLTDPTNNFRHELNVFFTRLLFCFFAEDTGLFNEKQFTNAVKLTQLDGTDLHDFFTQLFISLDSADHSGMPAPYSNFPHVNGSLFNTSKHAIAIPDFDHEARHLILECGSLNWGDINPDIFGTMFQGVVDPDHRDENGMDYTSVPNIMKVIEPLFLNELWERYYEIENTPSSLRELLERVRAIKIFDPACGSGNFLIISYKKLRQLENAILVRLTELKQAKRKKPDGNGLSLFTDEHLIDLEADAVDVRLFSGIELDNFYGIEIDDFAHELAILSLYLAKHQMDSEFEKQFPVKLKHLPLIENKNIIKANAAQTDWNDACENNGSDEIYLIGNPPYKGSRKQTVAMKSDMQHVFKDSDIANFKVLDYICIWFFKGAQYITNTNAQLAFVSTNSISQGDQVGIFWPSLLENIEIGFAYTSFKWQNSARDQAGVTCVIVSLRNPNKVFKYLFKEGIAEKVNIISAYLSSGTSTIILRRKSMLSSSLPPMSSGNYTGHALSLSLDKKEHDDLLEKAPGAERFIKKLVGSDEMIKGIDRWCIWISDADYDDAYSIPELKERIDATREARLGSKDPAANKLAKRPHQFRDRKETKTQSVVIPVISSENRQYIPVGIVGNDTILSNRVVAIYDAELYVFGLLTSAMHMAWLSAVCGRLETRYSYSVEICYTTYPIKVLTEVEKDALNKSSRSILLARAAHPEMTLADMYNPNKMPVNLREAHDANDRLVDSLYSQSGFKNDEDRLGTLFKLYEQMTAKP